MNNQMEFPDTWEEYEKEYGFEDSEKVYTNYARLIPSFKVKQWLEHKEKVGHWIVKDDKEQGYDIDGVKTWYIQIICSKCGFIKPAIEGRIGQYHFCPKCGARMESEI